VVLILAAGELPDRQLGPAPLLHPHPLDLPAGSDLSLQRLIRHYHEKCPQYALKAVIDLKSEWHHDCLGSQLDEIIEIEPQTSVCESLLKALEQTKEETKIIINPITALPDDVLIPTCAVVISESAQLRENWSSFRNFTPKGSEDLLSKLNKRTTYEDVSYAFTGILSGYCHQLKTELQLLEPAQRKDLGWLAAALLQKHQAKVVCCSWRDLGHRATYGQSRTEHLVSRSHNTVYYDPRSDLVIKKSKDRERLDSETSYLKNLPEDIKRFYPTIVNSKIEDGLALEYIPYPSLAELFLHWQVGWSGWNNIFKRLGWILDELKLYSTPIIASPSWLYSLKLGKRLIQINQSPPSANWKEFWNQPLKLNDTYLPSPRDCCDQLLNNLKPLEKNCSLQLIHGDLCFNNVLAEPLNGTVRLIDPRGERSPEIRTPQGYGDPRYELVKLVHSGIYLYDSVVHGFFSLDQDLLMSGEDRNFTNEWKAKIYPPKQYQMVAQLLTKFVRHRGLSESEQRWLSASLFFSMLPLHADSIQRQIILTLIGCSLVNDNFSSLLPCELP
jgi:hypothetical protein